MGLFNDLFAFIKDEETIEDSVLNDNTIQNQAKDTSLQTQTMKSVEFQQLLNNVFYRRSRVRRLVPGLQCAGGAAVAGGNLGIISELLPHRGCF